MRGKAFGGAAGLRARRDVGGGAGGAGALGCEEDGVSSRGSDRCVRVLETAGGWLREVACPPCPFRTWRG